MNTSAGIKSMKSQSLIAKKYKDVCYQERFYKSESGLVMFWKVETGYKHYPEITFPHLKDSEIVFVES